MLNCVTVRKAVWRPRSHFTVTSHNFNISPHSGLTLAGIAKGERYVEIPLFWKVVTLGGAIVLLLIPLMMVRQIIVERADYRDTVEDAIRQSTSGPQKVVGPLIAVPVSELYTVMEDDKK